MHGYLPDVIEEIYCTISGGFVTELSKLKKIEKHVLALTLAKTTNTLLLFC